MSNNITISGSKIGVLNTGDLAKINAVINATKGSDTASIGQTMAEFAQAIVDSNHLSDEAKRELGELIASLGDQIVGKRSSPVMKSLLEGIAERARPANDIFSMFEKLSGLVSQFL